MKKVILLMMTGLLVGSAAMAQTPATPTAQTQEQKKPDVLWMNEEKHDFGTIPQGKPVTTEFTMKNTGTDSLKLDMVQAGCGCTTPVWKPGPYAPGETFKITVGYNAAAVGQFNKPVTITYAGQQKVIYIVGTVFTTPATPAPVNNQLKKIEN
jgi:hypothetical protein